MNKFSKTSGDPVNRIGDLLVIEGLITEDQLKEALHVQKVKKNYAPLGKICVDLNFIQDEDLQYVLRKHKKNIFIGELLTNLGLVEREIFEKVLKESKRRKCKVGKLLVDLGHVSEGALINALSLQLGIPHVALDYDEIDHLLLKDIKHNFLKTSGCIPMHISNGKLTVAMADPLDKEVLDALENYYRLPIKPVLALRKEIDSILKLVMEGDTQVGVESAEINDLVVSEEVDIDDDTVVGAFNSIVLGAIRVRASDIHIEPLSKFARVRYRVDGVMITKDKISLNMMRPLTSRIKILAQLNITERRKHQDGRIKCNVMDHEVDLRVSTYVTPRGESVVIRLISSNTSNIPINKLGFNPYLHDIYMGQLEDNAGIILVTGPTGSGKTTTLYASLHYLNRDDVKIITVEDPIEYNIEGIIQGKIDPGLGQSYMDFLKSMMRQDPDVLMLGEIRDKVAAEATIQAALTGHKVFSTFHTEETTGALLRLMDMGIDTFLISTTVVSIISQRLVRCLCSDCKETYEPSQKALEIFTSIKNIDPKIHKFYRPVGCTKCDGIGYRGRIALHELLAVNDNVREAIFLKKNAGVIRNIARKKARMITMREDGFYKATKGITSIEEILRVTPGSDTDILYQHDASDLIDYCENAKPIPIEIDGKQYVDDFVLPENEEGESVPLQPGSIDQINANMEKIQKLDEFKDSLLETQDRCVREIEVLKQALDQGREINQMLEELQERVHHADDNAHQLNESLSTIKTIETELTNYQQKISDEINQIKDSLNNIVNVKNDSSQLKTRLDTIEGNVIDFQSIKKSMHDKNTVLEHLLSDFDHFKKTLTKEVDELNERLTNRQEIRRLETQLNDDMAQLKSTLNNRLDNINEIQDEDSTHLKKTTDSLHDLEIKTDEVSQSLTSLINEIKALKNDNPTAHIDDQIKKINSTIARIEEQSHDLVKSQEQTTEFRKSVEDDIGSLKSKTDQRLNGLKNDLSREIKNAFTQLKSHTDELEELKAQNVSGDVRKNKDEIERMVSQMDKTTQQLKDLSANMPDTQVIEQGQIQLTSQLDAVKSDLNSLQEAVTNSVTSETLQEMIDASVNTLRQNVQKDSDAASQSLAQLHKQITELKNDGVATANLTQKFEELQEHFNQQIESVHNAIDTNDSKIKKTLSHYASLSDYAEITNAIDNLTQRIENADSNFVGQDDFNKSIQTIQADLSHKSEGLSQTLSQLQSQLNELKNSDTVSGRLENLNTQMNEEWEERFGLLEQAMQIQKDQVDQKAAQINQTIAQLKERIDDSSQIDSQFVSLNSEVEGLKQGMTGNMSEVSNLISDLQAQIAESISDDSRIEQFEQEQQNTFRDWNDRHNALEHDVQAKIENILNQQNAKWEDFEGQFSQSINDLQQTMSQMADQFSSKQEHDQYQEKVNTLIDSLIKKVESRFTQLESDSKVIFEKIGRMAEVDYVSGKVDSLKEMLEQQLKTSRSQPEKPVVTPRKAETPRKEVPKKKEKVPANKAPESNDAPAADKKLVIKKKFYDTGEVMWEVPYINGKKSGVSVGYDKQGQIIKKVRWLPDGSKVDLPVDTPG